MTVTKQDLEKVFTYDPLSGLFFYVEGHKRAGQIAGHKMAKGYVGLSLNGVALYAHRAAWLLTFGECPPGDIDHINGNRLDNRLENLRRASRSQNNFNAATSKCNSTGYKGVSFIKTIGRYRATIRANGKSLHIGCFSSAEEAHAAYVHAAKTYAGEFARAA